MKTTRTTHGPFNSRPYYALNEIEEICSLELKSVGLFPKAPEPIRIDRFIEKRFNISPEYGDLPPSVLGFSLFGRNGVEAIIVARFLDEDASKQSERRIRTTLAHETGHVLLQGHLFALGQQTQSLFDNSVDLEKPKILCRDMPGVSSTNRSYDGRWWEFQANAAIGALLLPRLLVYEALSSLMQERGLLGMKSLPTTSRGEAVRILTEVFDVNSAVARIRTEEIFPPSDERQLTL